MHANGQAPHILIVDHAAEILDLMRELLEDEGYRVSGQLRTDQDIASIAAVAPDLIIIDYMWPSLDNEWTLLNLLTIDRRTRAIPVIVCTAAVTQVTPMEEHLASLGIRTVFKPFDIDHFLAEVAAALAAPRPSVSPE